MFGRADGETEDDYRARIVPLIKTGLALPRARVEDMRKEAEAKAHVTPEQSQKLDHAFDKIYGDVLDYTNKAITDGQLSPYDTQRLRLARVRRRPRRYPAGRAGSDRPGAVARSGARDERCWLRVGRVPRPRSAVGEAHAAAAASLTGQRDTAANPSHSLVPSPSWPNVSSPQHAAPLVASTHVMRAAGRDARRTRDAGTATKATLCVLYWPSPI